MDIESLKIFLDIRNSGTISDAADNNYISQSALSKRLAMLEKELGIRLFQREKGQSHAIITPVGETFSDIAERMIFLYQQAVELRNDPERRMLIDLYRFPSPKPSPRSSFTQQKAEQRDSRHTVPF